MRKDALRDDWNHVARLCWDRGYVSYSAGNMSVWTPITGMVITRRGTSFSSVVSPENLIYENHPEFVTEASSEWDVHKLMYERMGYGAILHAHPPCTVATTLCTSDRELKPMDYEGLFYNPGVRIISKEQAKVLHYIDTIFVVRGHGVFCHAEDLVAAFARIDSLEMSMKMIWMRNNFESTV